MDAMVCRLVKLALALAFRSLLARPRAQLVACSEVEDEPPGSAVRLRGFGRPHRTLHGHDRLASPGALTVVSVTTSSTIL